MLIFHSPIFPCKVIYLMRNPRDVFVSGYFFWNSVKFVKKPKSWEQYFEWFCQGNGECFAKYGGVWSLLSELI